MEKFKGIFRKTLTAISQTKNRNQPEAVKARVHHANANDVNLKCHVCEESHRLFNCKKFLSWDIKTRYEFVKSKKLCFVCLNKRYGFGNSCPSEKRCDKCNKSHHNVLHYENSGFKGGDSKSNFVREIPPYVPINMQKTFDEPSTSNAHTGVVLEANIHVPEKSQTLLSTAMIYLSDDEGNLHLCRALLDSGSDANFMTSKCAKKLNLVIEDTCMSLTGISEKTTIIRQKTKTTIKSHYASFKMQLEFSVMQQITGNKINRYFKVCNSIGVSSG